MKTENEGAQYGGRLWPDDQSSLPPPPSVSGGGGSSLWKLIVGIGGITVVIVAVTLFAMSSSPRETAGARDATQAPQEALDGSAEPPSTTPPEDEAEAAPNGGTEDPVTPDSSSELFGTFNAANGWTYGTDLRFGVLWIRYPWPKCNTHTFSTGGKPRGAFYSDCAWDDNDLAFFQVNFRNRSAQSITLTRLNLTLQTTDGRVLTPIDVGAIRRFLSNTHALGWRSHWTGWVAFDNSGAEIHPVSMSYLLGEETLTQRFEGSESVVSPR